MFAARIPLMGCSASSWRLIKIHGVGWPHSIAEKTGSPDFKISCSAAEYSIRVSHSPKKAWQFPSGVTSASPLNRFVKLEFGPLEPIEKCAGDFPEFSRMLKAANSM